MTKTITPKLGANSFTCPHCGAISAQTWYMTYIRPYEAGYKPWLPDIATIELLKVERPAAANDELIAHLKRVASKAIFSDREQNGILVDHQLINLTTSYCFSCKEWAVWVADNLIYPNILSVVEPNEEMPPDVRADFNEATAIVDKSPRGAAALLRLCIQRLMVHLKLEGNNLDDDIGQLVKRSLDSRIQKALDVVRVIGNNAVHPGQIDLRDDKTTAMELFDLVNLIVEAMIATPKHVEKMYGALPQGALDAIKNRDKDNT